MKKQFRWVGITILSMFCWLVGAQQKQVTIKDIFGGMFSSKGMNVLHSMKDGKHYTVRNYNRSSKTMTIDKYSYKTLEKVTTLLNTADLKEISRFGSYTFSQKEQKLILATQEESIYRHSKLGIYYLYDLKSKNLTKIFDQKIQEPTFSPDGTKIAFVFKNNLYVKDLASGKITQMTQDGKKNEIINGITDWVYEEEFSFVRAFDWNLNSNKIAFLRFDETEVPEFSMDVFGTELYQTQYKFKYPKAGEKNAIVSLHIVDINSGKINTIDLGKAYYIPRIKWTKEENILSVQVFNRHQNHLKLFFVDATQNNKAKIVLEEKDDAYLDTVDDLTFLENNNFIWSTEKSGYKHLYLYDRNGKEIRPITSGNWEVTKFYGFDPKTARIYYQSTEEGSIYRTVYSVGINGKRKRLLTKNTGTNSASFSVDFSYFINTYSSISIPNRYSLHRTKDGKELREIVNNNTLLKKWKDYSLSPKEFSTLTVNGNELNMWMIKPSNFDSNKQYPLLMYQYSGPGSQQVHNRWYNSNDYWYQMLAEEGYIIACVDGRGTGAKGRDFKKITQKELGKYEVEDQIAAAKQLGNLSYIDKSRIGIWGWSYGGFMSSNALFKGNDTFKMAIAVAPVTSWRFYDTIYTERYMTTPQENPNGYDDNSPINHVDKLKGDFLLIHGSGDDNVHLQNTMRMAEALIQADKQFEWMIYPDKNHGIYGGNTRIHLYKKMTSFIHKTLGGKHNTSKGNK